MIKTFKSNKFISILLVIMCIILMFNPAFYAKSCLNAISVWAFKVLPLMFPFFVFTRLIVNLNNPKQSFMDKFFNKLYNTPICSFSTFFLSALSGYPMGAKLISAQFENDIITKKHAKKMLSFCSVSGPMFMIGTVGVGMMKSYKAGVIILISNLIASLLNGLFYRGKKDNFTPNFTTLKRRVNNPLTDSVYDSLIAILMVGSYIVLSFIIIDILNNLHITSTISKIICCVCNIPERQDVVNSILNGSIEITRGILNLSNTNLPLRFKTIISSTLIGFGGISIILQSVSFLNKLNISIKSMLLQKTTQSILCLVISSLLCFILI